MDVSNRRFIRLEEISEKTALTRGDVLNAIDTGKLSFLASVDTKNGKSISLIINNMEFN